MVIHSTEVHAQFHRNENSNHPRNVSKEIITIVGITGNQVSLHMPLRIFSVAKFCTGLFSRQPLPERSRMASPWYLP